MIYFIVMLVSKDGWIHLPFTRTFFICISWFKTSFFFLCIYPTFTKPFLEALECIIAFFHYFLYLQLTSDILRPFCCYWSPYYKRVPQSQRLLVPFPRSSMQRQLKTKLFNNGNIFSDMASVGIHISCPSFPSVRLLGYIYISIWICLHI